MQLRETLFTIALLKSKRVTRSVLASEIYGMVEGVNMAIIINIIIKIIIKQLKFL